MKTNYALGDIKYYRTLHVLRMEARGESPISYPAFYQRVRKMNLHDAIYTPRAESMVRRRRQTPIQDEIRRKATLKANNMPTVTVNRYNMKPQKKGLFQKFISLFQ